jgi:hypothetical protein
VGLWPGPDAQAYPANPKVVITRCSVSGIDPAAASFAGGAARTPGFAAAARDAFKLCAYRQVSSTLPFVPMSVLRAPCARALTLLGDLAEGPVQADGPGLCQAAFISGRSGNSALPLARATRPYVGGARTSRREPLAGPRCVVLPGPRVRWFRPVLRPVCGFWVFGSASLSVA